MTDLQTQVSKQLKPFPATISRGAVPYLMSWRSLYTRHGYLSTHQMRRLGNWGLPGAAKATLIHQMTGLQYEILNPEGETDEQTEYSTMLLENANDGMGGSLVFFNRLADDIVTALEGGPFEIVRTDPGIPVAIYNVDASTIKPTFDPETPFYQKAPYTAEWIPFSRDELAQVLWYPFTEIESPFYSRSPIQMAYVAISILADGDDYNMRLLKEVIPQAILNLGPGFDIKKAREWKNEWDKAKEGGRLGDIGLLWGTDKAELLSLFPPPKDMGFENLEHWYATIIAACFEMSILDLGILTRVSTKAAAESQERISKRQGLRHLMQVIKQAVELYLLPEGYTHNWEDIDPTDEKDDAQIKRTRAFAVKMLCDALGPEVGPQEAARQGLLTEETRKAVEAIQKSRADARNRSGAITGLKSHHFEKVPIAPLTNLMAEMQEAVERLVKALQEDEITLATFEEGMREILAGYYHRVYEVVEGEPTPEVDYFLELLLEEEYGYLEGFVRDLRQEIESTGTVGAKAMSRASLYVSHLNSAWQRVLIEKLPRLEADLEYIVTWHVTPGAEHCQTCLMMAQGGPYTLEQLRKINIFPGHNTDCRANCMCHLEIKTRKRKEE